MFQKYVNKHGRIELWVKCTLPQTFLCRSMCNLQ